MNHAELMERARQGRAHAHAPYSRYRVGAAVLDETGRVHIGCNVENASFPLGTCAETNAVAAMVAAGGSRIAAIAVAGGADRPGPCAPCGGCRQVIAEFADAATRVLLLDETGAVTSHPIAELLPATFRLPS